MKDKTVKDQMQMQIFFIWICDLKLHLFLGEWVDG